MLSPPPRRASGRAAAGHADGQGLQLPYFFSHAWHSGFRCAPAGRPASLTEVVRSPRAVRHGRAARRRAVAARALLPAGRGARARGGRRGGGGRRHADDDRAPRDRPRAGAAGPRRAERAAGRLYVARLHARAEPQPPAPRAARRARAGDITLYYITLHYITPRTARHSRTRMVTKRHTSPSPLVDHYSRTRMVTKLRTPSR